MSLVGNFNSNYDREAAAGGVPTPEMQGRRPSQSHFHEDDNTSSDASTIAAQNSPPRSHHQPTGSVEKEVPFQHDVDQEETARRENEVLHLARRLTQQSTHSAYHQNPFHAAAGSALDPSGENFNARAWTKAMMNLQLSDENAAPPRQAGIAFKNLNVHGFGADTDYQKSVGNVWLEGPALIKKLKGDKGRKINILQNCDGLVEAGEMLVVLGPPGSGCSTFLKTVTGETHGFFVDENSTLNYQGVSPELMNKNYRGEAIYTAEVDVHFPSMTVGETLYFAALARRPRNIPGGVSAHEYATHQRDVIMAMYGISHTINTRVGNDFIRGVSGGERKRVTIAEASLSRAPLQAWDNSTRGLDSANAIEFVKTLRMETEINGTTACVAIYQAPQAAYDLFDKVLVLYEGHQIYYGRTTDAKAFFVNMGFVCPDRQTDADFLTSMTSPLERIVAKGFEGRVPRTAEEFAKRWLESPERAALVADIEAYEQKYPVGGEQAQKFAESRKLQQAKGQRAKSPYTLSYTQQVKLCLWRGFVRLKADPSITLTQLIANSIMALIISSVFYNLQMTTSSFFQRSALLFFAILMNAFGSALEILTLYAQRPIVEKHSRYALYHPSAEAFASMLTDMPYKIVNAITFNLVLYFMTNLRREPGNFFFFVLISFTLTLVMSMFFRSIASLSKSLVQALAPAAILILGLVIYTGFAIPPSYMLGWSKWIRYINPVSYGFESLMVNEFVGQQYLCNMFTKMTSPGPSSRIHSGAVTPLHPRAGGTATESPTSWPDDGKQQSHRLPLPPISVSYSSPFCPSSSASASSPVPRSPGKVENPASPGSRWKKGRLLGRGTFGHVYLGFNSGSGEMCAMKEVTLFSDDAKSKESAKQLMQEIALLSRLRHPNIVQYYGSETVDDKLYIYLEFVSGGSIYKLLQDYGRLGEQAIRSYTQQILSGLAYLHATHTVHRDIKGANILVDPSGRVKLADFGMAKHITGQSCPLSFKGSPYWMAPEVIKNSNGCNLAVDIWSLGCTVLEMATTKPPWSQFEGVAAMFKIGNSKELPAIPEHLSDDGKDFVRQCLQRNPSHRPTAARLLEHPFVKNAAPLERPISGSESSEPPSGLTTALRSLGDGHARNLSFLDSEGLVIRQSRGGRNGPAISDSYRNISCPVSPIGSPLMHSRSPQHVNGWMSPSPISSPRTMSGSSSPLTGGSGALPFHHLKQSAYLHEGYGSMQRSPNSSCANDATYHDLKPEVFRGKQPGSPVFWELVSPENDVLGKQFGRPVHGDPRELYDGQSVLADRVSQQLLRDHAKLKASMGPNTGSLMLGRANGITPHAEPILEHTRLFS